MAEPTGEESRRLPVAGLGVVALLGIGAFLPRPSDPNLLFGIDGYRPAGPVPFLAAAALLVAILFWPGLAARVARALGRLGSLRPAAGGALVVLASGALFWVLPNHRLSGDAGSVLLFTATGDVHPSNALTSWIQHGVARLLSLDPVTAIRLVSCLAGMVYAAAGLGIARVAFAPGPRRVGVAVVLLTAGTVALFFGTIEVYAPLAAAIAVYLYLGLRWLKGAGRGIAAPLALGVAFVLHGSAGLLLPSLLVLVGRGRLRPWPWRRSIGWGIAFLVPVLAVLTGLWFGTWEGVPPEPGPRLTGTFLGVADQSPLIPLVLSAHDPIRRYAFFDGEHTIGILNVIALVALPALALLAVGRRRFRDPDFLFVAVVGAFLVLFPFFWNISYDLVRDWDLFSPLGIPLALLGGLAFFTRPATAADTVRAAALCVFVLAPFVVSNSLLHRHRHEYTETVSQMLVISLPMSVARTAVAEMLDGPARDAVRPEERPARVWREDLEQFANALLERRRPFRPPDVEGCLDGLPPLVAEALELPPTPLPDPASLASVLVEELGRAARGARSPPGDAPPLEVLSAVAARRVAARRELRLSLPSGPPPEELELLLLDALDAGLERAGAYDLVAHPVDAAALRAEARKGFADTFGPTRDPSRPDPGRWGNLLADSLLRTLDTVEDPPYWRTLLAAQRKWEARERALLPPGYLPAVRRIPWLREAARDPAPVERYARHWLAKLPGDALWLSLLGDALVDAGRREEGAECFRRSLDADPENLRTRIRLANLLVSDGKLEAAEALLARGLRICGFHAEVPGALFQLAWVRLQRGEAELAASHLRAALDHLDRAARSPENDALRVRVGDLLRRVGDGAR